MAMQIVYIKETAEIKYRYRTSYLITTPIDPSTQLEAVETATTSDQTETQGNTPLGQKEMLFFNFPKLGVTSVVKYDFNTKDWAYT